MPRWSEAYKASERTNPHTVAVSPEAWAVLALHGPRPLIPHLQAFSAFDGGCVAKHPALFVSPTLASYRLRLGSSETGPRSRPSCRCPCRVLSRPRSAEHQVGLCVRRSGCSCGPTSTEDLSRSQPGCLLPATRPSHLENTHSSFRIPIRWRPPLPSATLLLRFRHGLPSGDIGRR